MTPASEVHQEFKEDQDNQVLLVIWGSWGRRESQGTQEGGDHLDWMDHSGNQEERDSQETADTLGSLAFVGQRAIAETKVLQVPSHMRIEMEWL